MVKRKAKLTTYANPTGKPCNHCGKPMPDYPGKNRVFCSAACALVFFAKAEAVK